MDWIAQPMTGFRSLDMMMADTCTGDGTKLNSCSCTGGLVVCQCSGGLTVPKPKEELN
jgi:hypothetical protein